MKDDKITECRGVIKSLGTWQSSHALALQASLGGSVTRRLHQLK